MPVLRVSTHIYGISQEIDGETIHLEITARHMIPQIDHHGKMSPVLMVSTHIYGLYKYINGKTLIFENKPRHVTLKSIILEKGALFLVFQHSLRISPVIDGKSFILLGKTRHVTPQIDNHRRSSPVPRVITHIYRISKGIDR